MINTIRKRKIAAKLLWRALPGLIAFSGAALLLYLEATGSVLVKTSPFQLEIKRPTELKKQQTPTMEFNQTIKQQKLLEV